LGPWPQDSGPSSFLDSFKEPSNIHPFSFSLLDTVGFVSLFLSWATFWVLYPCMPSIFLPGESHGQRSLAGCNPWGLRESDMITLRFLITTLFLPVFLKCRFPLLSRQTLEQDIRMREMMLEKRQIQEISLLKFKMGGKAVETTVNINNAFGPGAANKRAVQWWFKKFCKGDAGLEDEERSGQPAEVDNNQLRAIIDVDLLTTTQEVAEELSVDHSTWVSHELTANQKKKKNHHFEVLSSLILNNNEQFLDRILTCDQNSVVWSAEEAPKHFPKPNLHQKEGHGHCLVVYCWSDRCSFLNPAQQIDEMHRKLQHLHPDLVNTKGTVFLHDYAGLHVTPPMLQKLNELGYQVLPHPPYSPDLLPTDYHLLKHLNNVLQGKCFHNQQEVENASQEMHKLISHWQKCVYCNGSYFD
ncbi:hypothetical protein FD754_008184, partial [Muntiacus muntjak]